MSRLEQVVRPVILPDTTPIAKQIAIAQDDDSQVEITSGGASPIDFRHSRHWAYSKQRELEVSRRVDVMRVFNPEDHSQYVDMEVATRIDSVDGNLGPVSRRYTKPAESEHVQRLEENKEIPADQRDRVAWDYINRDFNTPYSGPLTGQ